MKERPIIFSGEMVRAILESRKTMTRRVIQPQPPTDERAEPWTWDIDGKFPRYALGWRDDEDICCAAICRYGQPGDRLWVREGIRRHFPLEATYTADLTPVMGKGPTGSSLYGRAQVAWLWKRDYLPARFMPRWSSRINLEITSVRVERLQEISEADAIAEGISEWTKTHGFAGNFDGRVLITDWVLTFADMWESINAKRGHPWESNPFVWVIKFRRLT